MSQTVSRSKLWYITVPLILVFLLLIYEIILVLPTNKIPFLNLGRFSPQLPLSQNYAKYPNQNPDNTYTLLLNFSRLENVEEKSILLKSYTALHLRPVKYENGNLGLGDLYEVDLPNNLKSTLSINGANPTADQLKNFTGQRISLQLTVNQLKQSYSAFDIVGWSVIYVE